MLIPALVKDQQGGIVYGLQAKDFIVEDDGVEQPARLDEAPEGQPISLVVAIQRGRRAYARVPPHARPENQCSTRYSPWERRELPLWSSIARWSSQEISPKMRAWSATILRNLQPGDGGATILDAVNYSVNLLKKEPEDRLRVLLLISETRDHGSHVKIDDAVSAIGQSNAVMYALAFSPALSNILDTGRGTNKNEMHEGVEHPRSRVPPGAGHAEKCPEHHRVHDRRRIRTLRHAQEIRSADE